MTVRNIQKQISNSGTRQEVRKRIIHLFMKEQPGEGKGKFTSRYNYYVEKLSDGKHIILTRPANLKNGFDFLIRVEDIDFSEATGRKRDYPKHEDIVRDLKQKKQMNIKTYKRLYELIKRVYKCEDINPREFEKLNFKRGFPVDMILSVIKWFFIEQDIRYWNYSGRNMFMSAIPSPETDVKTI